MVDQIMKIQKKELLEVILIVVMKNMTVHLMVLTEVQMVGS
jgi:hypothetical protein